MTVHIPPLLLYLAYGIGGVVVVALVVILLMLAWIGWKVTNNLGPPSR